MATQYLLGVCVTIATLWSPMATQQMAPINPDNLSETGAHVCVTSIQETYTETESYTAYGTKKTYTWCLNWNPRCTEYSLTSHVAYRTVTKTRTRKKLFCCEGFTTVTGRTYCKPMCEKDCHNSLGYGYCAFPGLCICNNGRKGDSCESNCTQGWWGPDCSRQCTCGSHGSCDPTNGNCVCHIGWTGTSCDQPCINSFGMHCVNPCVCENNSTCSNINGKCTCQPGYYGAYCHKECDYTSIIEDTCVQVCACQNGACDSNNVCVCDPGYKGTYCNIECDEYHWGVNCVGNCNCYNGVCDSATGECTCNYGYGGSQCNTNCKEGYYGTLCATKCPCKNNGRCYFGSNQEIKCNCAGTGFHGITCSIRDCPRDQSLVDGKCEDCSCPWATTESCHPITGKCECRTGYIGASCNVKCTMPFWGVNCEEECKCAHGDCHFQDGSCQNCYAGYTGTNCDEECPEGTWGIGCNNKCGCLNNADCHETTGFCNCTAGYKGLLCGQQCDKDEWGKFCNKKCTCNVQKSICNPYNGECQCKPGYNGTNCENKCLAWSYGFHCRHECQCDRTGTKTCDHVTGECKCAPGYKGVTCSSECPDQRWGPDCLESCDCNSQGSCDQTDGTCICYAGYTGDRCQNICEDGYFGYDCTEECPVCTDGLHCDHISGQCISDQCQAGFTGKDCKTPCPSGTWGVKCVNRCSATCTTNGICSPVTGHCFCFPGYSGTNCEHACENWKYGIGCSNDCDCVRTNTETCSVSRGVCTCKPGYIGNRCERSCDAGKWGHKCKYDCSENCNRQHSSGCDVEKGLPCVCVDGWEPPYCNEQSGFNIVNQQTGGDSKAISTPIMAVVIVASLIALAIIVFLVVYFRCKIQRLKEQNLSVRYAANGAIPGQTVVPNGGNIGMINPTYAEDNLNNERRYPHLSQRRALPTPQRPCSGESFDSIDDDKRQNTMSSQRPESSHYHELDDERYTTLRSVAGAQASPDDKNLHVDNYQSKVADKYVFYSGEKGCNKRSRSPQMSYTNTRDSVNHGFGNDETDLKQNNLDLAAAFRPSSDTSSYVTMNANNSSRISTGYEKPVSKNLPKVSNTDNTSEASRDKDASQYSTPNADTGSLQSPTNGGYITPQNDINDAELGNSNTLPFNPVDDTANGSETPAANSVEDAATGSETPAVENDNFQNWITFDSGITEEQKSPYTNA